MRSTLQTILTFFSFLLTAQQGILPTFDGVGTLSTKLDGEKLNGDALSISLNRNTKNWNSEVEYKHYSPHYQTPLGFVTQNSIKTLSASQDYQHFFDKEDYFKQLNIGVGSELIYNYNSLRKFLNFDAYTFVQMKHNIRSEISFSHVVN
jgi:hypothetical protein